LPELRLAVAVALFEPVLPDLPEFPPLPAVLLLLLLAAPPLPPFPPFPVVTPVVLLLEPFAELLPPCAFELADELPPTACRTDMTDAIGLSADMVAGAVTVGVAAVAPVWASARQPAAPAAAMAARVIQVVVVRMI
jgi:hypothetical protein